MATVRTNGTAASKKKAVSFDSVDAAIQSLLRTSKLQGGTHTGTWDYHSADGALCFRVARFDLPNREKEFRPIRPEGDRWVVAYPPGPLPPYNLPRLAGAKHARTLQRSLKKRAGTSLLPRELRSEDNSLGARHVVGVGKPIATRNERLYLRERSDPIHESLELRMSRGRSR